MMTFVGSVWRERSNTTSRSPTRRSAEFLALNSSGESTNLRRSMTRARTCSFTFILLSRVVELR